MAGDEEGDFGGVGDGEVDDDLRVVEVEGADEVAEAGAGEGDIAVAGVFEAVDGAEFAEAGGELTDLAPGGIGEVVHGALGKAVGESEDRGKFGEVGGGERGGVGGESGGVKGHAVELAEDDGLDAGGGGGGTAEAGAVRALLAEVEVADGAGGRHVAEVGGDAGEVLGGVEFGEFAVFVAGGAEKTLFEGEAGGAVGQGAVAHVGVAVVEPGDDDDGTVIDGGGGGTEVDRRERAPAYSRPPASIDRIALDPGRHHHDRRARGDRLREGGEPV